MVANVIEHPFSAGVIPTPYNPDPVLLAIMEIVREGLRRDHYVRLHNFGTFRLRWSKARRVRHPKTGEFITVPPAPKVTFTPAKHLRELVEPNRAPVIPVQETSEETQASPGLTETVLDIIDEQYHSPEIPVRDDIQSVTKSRFNKKTLLGLLAAVPLMVALLQADFGGDNPATSQAGNQSATPQTSVIKQPVQNKIFRTDAVTSTQRQNSINRLSETQPTAHPKPTPKGFYFSPQVHIVHQDDNLWNLAKQYYGNALLWPHIYRANQRTLTDPDKIISGNKLVIPGLQQAPGKLTRKDREQIAEGYFQVYQFKKNERNKAAIYFLIGAKHYSFDWLQQNKSLITREDWLKIQK
jgi:nucleoid DNA-binding protein